MSGTIDFANSIPKPLLLQQPVTSSKSVLRKQLFEFQARDASSFSPTGVKNIKIIVSSNTDFLVGPESYMKFILTPTYSVSTNARLGFPGVNALFRKCEIKLMSSGTTVQLCDYYNKVCAIRYKTELSDAELAKLAVTEFASEPNGGYPFCAKDADRALFQTGWDAIDTWVTPSGRCIDSGNAQSVTCRLNMSFLQMHIPLFLLKGGFEINLELESFSQAFVGTGANTDGTYTITSCAFMGMLQSPHPDIVEEFAQQWRSPQGLTYLLPSWRVKSHRGDSGATASALSCQIYPGVRSARKMWVMVGDSTLSEASANSSAFRTSSIDLALYDCINEYQARVGSYNYPYLKVDNRPVWNAVTETDSGSEVNMHALYETKNSQFLNSGHNYVFGGAATDPTQDYHCHHKVMYVDFRRDNGSDDVLCGVDLSIVPLDFHYARTGIAHNATVGVAADLPGTPVLYFLIEHDAVLQLSAAQTIVLN
jgi:hypothetical protein